MTPEAGVRDTEGTGNRTAPAGEDAAPSRAAHLLRRLDRRARQAGLMLWAPPASAWRDPAAARRRGLTNRRYLRDRLIALPLLAVLAFASFGWAYGTVREESAQLRHQLVPALADLAQARISVQVAQQDAESTLRSGSAAELSGLGELYRTRMARTSQSIAAVTRGGALTVPEEQRLQIVSALVVDYGSWIGRAQGHAADTTLREAELTYARSMVCKNALSPGASCKPSEEGAKATTIVDRLVALEAGLRQRLHDSPGLGAVAWAASVLSLAAFVLLTAGLWRTLHFLRVRFRIWPSLPLLLAALPLLAVPFFVADAVLATIAQHRVRAEAAALADTTPKGETDADHEVFGRPSDPARTTTPSVAALARRADLILAGGGFGPLAAARPALAPAGLLAALVAGGTLYAYQRDYIVVTRPGAAV